MNWFSRTVRPRAAKVKQLLAPFVGANDSDIVWIENASNGINAVLRSFPFKATDTVMYFDIAYGLWELLLNMSRDGEEDPAVRGVTQWDDAVGGWHYVS